MNATTEERAWQGSGPIAKFFQMNLGRIRHRGSPELEATLRRMVVVFRTLGLAWMLILVITIMATNPPPRLWVVWASVALAILWTLLTWYMARARPEAMAGLGWLALDTVAMLAIGAASVGSGATELFHGGLPLSYVFVGALVGGLPWSLVAATLLAVEQFAVHLIANLGAVRAAGSVIFFVVAAIVGWTYDKLRDYDLSRQEALGALTEERAARAVQEERGALADRLHDSVLQTLHAIRIGADDPGQSRYLARRQERELRRVIEQFRSPYEESFRAALLAVRDDVEDTHPVLVDAVIRDDAELTEPLRLAIETAREAMTNAAKHSGAKQISLFAEFEGPNALIHVKDGGNGFSDDHQQVQRRLATRVERVGGLVVVDSSNSGTEVKITVGRS